MFDRSGDSALPFRGGMGQLDVSPIRVKHPLMAALVKAALSNVAAACRLAVFGSVARGEAREDSDIDLLVESPEGISSFGPGV